MDFNIQGKTVLVTAASQGIGRAIAEMFIQEGCKVAICSRSRENLVKAADEMKAAYGIEPQWVVCNITHEKEIIAAVDSVVKNFGPIDILINNCGGPVPGSFDVLSNENWQNAFDQVLMSAVKFTRRVLPAMKERKWGRIINITSVSVKEPIDDLMLSNSLRTGLIGFAKTLSKEVGKHNITVNNVAPGYTLTSRLYEIAVEKAKESGKSHEEVLADMVNDVAVRRLAKAEEIAALAVFLASEQASYITGTTIPVCGGRVKSLY
jgi:3-oxoacyl-[acyl-carrier protein] reductase